MGRVTALLALVAGLAASAPAQAQPAPLLPLVVDEATVLPGAPGEPVTDRVSVTVRNPGTRTIVAWGVRGQVEFADGKTRPIGLSTDGAIVTLNQRGSSVLPPDGRYTITADAASRPTARREDVRAVTARATFVIFDDDTALGDERSIGFHFAEACRQPTCSGRSSNGRSRMRWLARTDPREALARCRSKAWRPSPTRGFDRPTLTPQRSTQRSRQPSINPRDVAAVLEEHARGDSDRGARPPTRMRNGDGDRRLRSYWGLCGRCRELADEFRDPRIGRPDVLFGLDEQLIAGETQLVGRRERRAVADDRERVGVRGSSTRRSRRRRQGVAPVVSVPFFQSLWATARR